MGRLSDRAQLMPNIRRRTTMYRQERESGYSPVVSRLRIIQGSSQMYMLSLFHGENMGSIPLGRANEINQLVHKICGMSFTNAASADANADDASDGATRPFRYCRRLRAREGRGTRARAAHWPCLW
jgi:hypothetical protein